MKGYPHRIIKKIYFTIKISRIKIGIAENSSCLLAKNARRGLSGRISFKIILAENIFIKKDNLLNNSAGE